MQIQIPINTLKYAIKTVKRWKYIQNNFIQTTHCGTYRFVITVLLRNMIDQKKYNTYANALKS